MRTTPKDFIARLAALAAEARHHPQPAVAVALLAQLLLDLVAELQPVAEKYALLMRSGGALAVIEELDRNLMEAELQMGAAALPAAQAGTYQDLQADSASLATGGHDPAQDTTGTAG